jgi:DNA polymerase-1
MSQSPLLLLIDGHSLAFRAYYALAKSRSGALRTSSGIPTSVCFGFLNSLLQVIELEKPHSVAIAFDRKEATFRHEADPQYKADRKETPEDFIEDINNLQQLLLALNLTIVTAPGYEADDVIGTLAQQGSQEGYQVKILSGDRDLFQLIDPRKHITVLYLEPNAIKSSSKQNYREFDSAAVAEKMGIKPSQIVDYKALCGDKSDNIPGIQGIGDKTAVKLLQEYDSLANIYQNLSTIKGKNQQKLETGKKDAEHSQYLAQIILDTPLDITIADCKLKPFNLSEVKPLLETLELNKFSKQIEKIVQQNQTVNKIENNIPIKTNNQQLSLFDIAQPQTINQSQTNGILDHVPIKPEIIDTEAKLNQLIKTLKQYTDPNYPVAWDTETTALDPRDAILVGIGCCWGNNPTDVAYIPIHHTTENPLAKDTIFTALRPILESSKYPKVFQNTKFDRSIFYHQGIKLDGVVFDTMLASYILNPDLTHNLTDLSQRYLSDIISYSYKDLEIPKGKTIADLDIKTVAKYCGMDVYATFALFFPLKTALEAIPELNQLLLEVEQPLEKVLTKMENIGIKIDSQYLNKFSLKLEEELNNLEKQTYQDAGEEFNLGSPKQLSEILFDKLGLNKKKSRKIKTGYSTDHATLEKLQGDHPVIDHILEYRTLSKLKSTYVDALPALVHPKTKRLHTDFNQAITSTGRLSSSNPNLQNIPIRTEFSRQIRQAFIPQENWLLVSADYSQIELRILAHLSQEPVLLEAYRTGQDVHTVTAKLLFEKETITSEERRLGKIINFGVIYGMGAQKFAREAGVTAKEGKEFIDLYRQRYARVFTYLENLKKRAIADGFVTTILGRRRYFNFVSDHLRKARGSDPNELNLEQLKYTHEDAQLLRAAANAPIQGSSADIIKIAMVKLEQILANYQARLLLQVHDELVLEIPLEEWEDLELKIKSTMENAVNLSIPLVIDIHSGKNWMEAK